MACFVLCLNNLLWIKLWVVIRIHKNIMYTILNKKMPRPEQLHFLYVESQAATAWLTAKKQFKINYLTLYNSLTSTIVLPSLQIRSKS